MGSTEQSRRNEEEISKMAMELSKIGKAFNRTMSRDKANFTQIVKWADESTPAENRDDNYYALQRDLIKRKFQTDVVSFLTGALKWVWLFLLVSQYLQN